MLTLRVGLLRFAVASVLALAGCSSAQEEAESEEAEGALGAVPGATVIAEESVPGVYHVDGDTVFYAVADKGSRNSRIFARDVDGAKPARGVCNVEGRTVSITSDGNTLYVLHQPPVDSRTKAATGAILSAPKAGGATTPVTNVPRLSKQIFSEKNGNALLILVDKAHDGVNSDTLYLAAKSGGQVQFGLDLPRERSFNFAFMGAHREAGNSDDQWMTNGEYVFVRDERGIVSYPFASLEDSQKKRLLSSDTNPEYSVSVRVRGFHSTGGTQLTAPSWKSTPTSNVNGMLRMDGGQLSFRELQKVPDERPASPKIGPETVCFNLALYAGKPQPLCIDPKSDLPFYPLGSSTPDHARIAGDRIFFNEGMSLRMKQFK